MSSCQKNLVNTNISGISGENYHKRKLESLKKGDLIPHIGVTPRKLDLFKEDLPLQFDESPRSPVIFRTPYKEEIQEDLSEDEVICKNLSFDEDFTKQSQERPSTPPRMTQSLSQNVDFSSPKTVPVRLSVDKIHVNPFSPGRNLLHGSFLEESPRELPQKKIRHEVTPVSSDTQSQSEPEEIIGYFSRYLNDFRELTILGEGSFGKVTKCINLIDGLEYAIKKTNKEITGEKEEETILKEVHALATLVDNPYIVRYYSSWIEEKRIFIQLELCEGGSLYKKIGDTFIEKDLIRIIRQIGFAINQMHSHNLLHLDIKPENIYIKNGQYRLGDLGLVSSTLNYEECLSEGDARYLAPEVLSEENPGDPKKIDIFALGCSVYELASRDYLDPQGIEWNKIRRGEISLSNYSKDFENFIKKMMNPNPKLRPTALEIITDPLIQCKELRPHEYEVQINNLKSIITKQESTQEFLKETIQKKDDEIKRLKDQLKKLQQ